MSSNKYPSKYSPGKLIRPDQYLAEIVCENRAKYLKTELPLRFWVLPEWRNYYLAQLRRAKTLLGQFEYHVILAVVKNLNIGSLYPKWLINKLEEEREKQNLATKAKNAPADTVIMSPDEAHPPERHTPAKYKSIFPQDL